MIELSQWVAESYADAATTLAQETEDRGDAQFMRGFAAAMNVIAGRLYFDSTPELTAINDRHHASIDGDRRIAERRRQRAAGQ